MVDESIPINTHPWRFYGLILTASKELISSIVALSSRICLTFHPFSPLLSQLHKLSGRDQARSFVDQGASVDLETMQSHPTALGGRSS